MSEDLSLKMRAYLAEIYRLSDRDMPPDGYVSTSALSELLDVTAPAVNRMVNRLKEQGLLDHQPYQGIRLTAKGQTEALKQLRAHRIAEVFLVKIMGFKWDEVYTEASQMSLALNDVLLERMLAMTEHPAFCPHGEPIPDAAGQIVALGDELLAAAPVGVLLRVTRLRTREKERLHYIEALGLLPGAEVEILHMAPFNGPLQLKLGHEYRIVGHNLAELIRVRPAADPAR